MQLDLWHGYRALKGRPRRKLILAIKGEMSKFPHALLRTRQIRFTIEIQREPKDIDLFSENSKTSLIDLCSTRVLRLV